MQYSLWACFIFVRKKTFMYGPYNKLLYGEMFDSSTFVRKSFPYKKSQSHQGCYLKHISPLLLFFVREISVALAKGPVDDTAVSLDFPRDGV